MKPTEFAMQKKKEAEEQLAKTPDLGLPKDGDPVKAVTIIDSIQVFSSLSRISNGERGYRLTYSQQGVLVEGPKGRSLLPFNSCKVVEL